MSTPSLPTAASRESTGTGVFGGIGELKYDLHAGTVTSYASCDPGTSVGSIVTAADEYTLVGAPARRRSASTPACT